MKILLTGASGYIGKLLSSDLQTRGFEVVGTSFEKSIKGLLKCDLRIQSEVQNLPPCDAIIHLAQSPHYRNFPEKANDIFNVNVSSTQYLLEYARKNGIKKFIYMSTGSVYDLGLNSDIVETSPISPNSYYAMTKLMGEQMVMSYKDFFQCISLRLFNPYSHVDNGKLISNIFNSIETRKEIFLAEDAGVKMNPIYLKDLNRALFTLLTTTVSDSDVYNMGGPESCTLKDFALKYSKLLDLNPNFVPRDGSLINMTANIDKFVKTFNFEFKFDLNFALQEILQLRTGTSCLL